MTELDLLNAAFDELDQYNKLQAERNALIAERNALTANQMIEEIAAVLSGELSN